VYLNRQTAVAHHLVFQQIEAIIKQDTGQSLKWRHLHATSADELIGILQWTGDQHGGQAKGKRFLFQSDQFGQFKFDLCQVLVFIFGLLLPGYLLEMTYMSRIEHSLV
jgi:hypothetical protein